MSKYLSLAIISFLLLACGKKSFKPIYNAKPIISNLPDYDFIDERNVPQDESFTLRFALSTNSTPNEEEYFNNPGAISSDGKAPTVIIAPPKEIEILGEKVKEFDGAHLQFDKVFKTDGYFNEAEQAIEKALLKIGFNVLDRSKFEAKLRDLRDRANERPYWYNTWTEKLLENGEYDVVKDEYKKQLKEGVITTPQYMEIINEVDKRSQRGLPGKKREEDEMNDIAEVIRAAQTGADQAEYLLQINEVTVSDAGDRTLKINELEDVQDFIDEHHGLKFGRLPKSLPASIPSKWLRATFNAKLIEVKSGSIVWIGSHEIESSSAEEIEISFDVDKNISNEDDVNGSIQQYNKRIKKENEELLKLNVELSSLYEEAMVEKKLDNSASLVSYTSTLKSKITGKESAYNDKLNSMRELLNNSPLKSSKNWEYSYDVGSPIVNPDLLAIGQNGGEGEQRFKQHRKKLINKITQELIGTIMINE